jgi:putative transposase
VLEKIACSDGLVHLKLGIVYDDKLGECWSMDFMSDSSRNQRRFRTFNVIDDFNRETLGINITVSLPAGKLIRYLDKLAEYHGNPLKIQVDNGPEFTANTFTN